MRIISCFLIFPAAVVSGSLPERYQHLTKRQANPVELWVYETDDTIAESLPILQTPLAKRIGGTGKFNGFGSKYQAVLPELEKVEADTIVVLSDGRDVLMNKVGLKDFENKFEVLTRHQPEAIVVSAEAQCCVSALTYAKPGDYIQNGERVQRACTSGSDGCLWKGDEFATPWEDFMHEAAFQQGNGSSQDIYLNAGLIVGRAQNLIRVFKRADIQESEDDQAVLTDYMYRFRDEIVLDYNQEIFGNNRDTCMFSLDGDRLVHKETKTSPLLIHSPGGNTECHEELQQELGQTVTTKVARRRLFMWKSTSHNYKCKAGDKLVSNCCVKNWCYDDYKCPANSHRKPNRFCYNNFDDCECESGFCKVNGKCQRQTKKKWGWWWY